MTPKTIFGRKRLSLTNKKVGIMQTSVHDNARRSKTWLCNHHLVHARMLSHATEDSRRVSYADELEDAVGYSRYSRLHAVESLLGFPGCTFSLVRHTIIASASQ